MPLLLIALVLGSGIGGTKLNPDCDTVIYYYCNHWYIISSTKTFFFLCYSNHRTHAKPKNCKPYFLRLGLVAWFTPGPLWALAGLGGESRRRRWERARGGEGEGAATGDSPTLAVVPPLPLPPPPSAVVVGEGRGRERWSRGARCRRRGGGSDHRSLYFSIAPPTLPPPFSPSPSPFPVTPSPPTTHLSCL